MSLLPPSELRTVHGITEEQAQAITTFMQGAVYCWVKNRKDEPFAVRDLMGGENFLWEGTPLQVLYDKHVHGGKNHDAAVEAAGKDLGWLTKSMLHADKRTFRADHAGLVASYQWVGSEP